MKDLQLDKGLLPEILGLSFGLLNACLACQLCSVFGGYIVSYYSDY